ncbi:hypothetical protein U3516DRAFT_848989 [Neocallimastix sp. 'constans']
MVKKRIFKTGDRKKKHGKRKPVFDTKKTFVELLDEAVKQEEKGERYGSGNKARKYYETACDFYERAHKKDEKDFSCIYNWARVTYILATFTNPAYNTQKRLDLLQLSIDRFKRALAIDPYALDAMFNLKQALSNFGEICLDEISNQAALSLYREACELGEKLFKLQKEVYIREENENKQNIKSNEEKRTDQNLKNNKMSEMDIENNDNSLNSEKEKSKDNTIMEKEEVYCEKDSTYATILSSRGEHLFNSMNIFDAIFFEKALEHQTKVIQRIIPEKSNSLVIYHQKAKELCNKGDILCTFGEILIKNGESVDEFSPSQEMYREALSIYEKALTYEESNNSILCKIGDMKLILARNYLLLSQQKFDDAYQSMLKLIRQGLDIYKIAIKNSISSYEQQPLDPEIYLRIAKGLSYYNDLTVQCQKMLQKFIQVGGSLEILENDYQLVNFDFSDDIKNVSWFNEIMSQLE